MKVWSAWYRLVRTPDGLAPVIYLRTGDGVEEITGFRPYCFVHPNDVKKVAEYAKTLGENPVAEDTDLILLPYREGDMRGGAKAVKLTFRVPRHVGEVRKRAWQIARIPVWEADIPFVQRYMIDSKITYDPEAPVLFFDVEVDDSRGFPDPAEANMRVLSIAAVEPGGEPRFWHVDDYDTELHMLADFLGFASRYAVLAAWYGLKFDFPYLVNRFERLASENPELAAELAGGEPWVERGRRGEIRLLDDYWQWFDMLFATNWLFKLREKSLEYAAIYFDLPVRKVVRAVRVHELSREELEEYNVTDALILREIEAKTQIVATNLVMAEIAGMLVGSFFPANTYSGRRRPVRESRKGRDYAISAAIDTIMLRMFRERGYVLPSKPAKAEGEKYAGALVLDAPPRGLYPGVGVIDFASMYPNIMISKNLSPEVYYGLAPPDKPGVVPTYLEWVYRERKKYKKLAKTLPPGPEKFAAKVRQQALKILLNATYGTFGYAKFRLHIRRIAETVTASGRQAISSVAEYMKSKGVHVLYGDTDSLFVVLPWPEEKRRRFAEMHVKALWGGCEECREEARRLAEEAWRDLERFAEEATRVVKEQLGLKTLDMDVDKLASLYYSTGVKKKYALLLAAEGGNPIVDRPVIEIKGLESVRTDREIYLAETVAEILPNLFKSYVGLADPVEEARKRWEELSRGRVPPEKLLRSVGLTKGLEEYKNEAQHVRAARLLLDHGYPVGTGDKIQYVVLIKGRIAVRTPDGKWLIEGYLKPVDEEKVARLLDYNHYAKILATRIEEYLGVHPAKINSRDLFSFSSASGEPREWKPRRKTKKEKSRKKIPTLADYF